MRGHWQSGSESLDPQGTDGKTGKMQDSYRSYYKISTGYYRYYVPNSLNYFSSSFPHHDIYIVYMFCYRCYWQIFWHSMLSGISPGIFSGTFSRFLWHNFWHSSYF